MIKHSLVQGSPEWLHFRANHFGASDVAAMLGIDPNKTRDQLLHEKYTGLSRAVSDYVQVNVFDYGHEVEEAARTLFEIRVGEDFYPITVSEGILSASCDGLNLSDTCGWEHKQWNEALAESVRTGVVPDSHMGQIQQQLMITGAISWVFSVSNGTGDFIAEISVDPDHAWFASIRAGWEQFKRDLDNYTPPVIVEPPAAQAVRALPALYVQARGEVTTSNLPEFGEAAGQYLARIAAEVDQLAAPGLLPDRIDQLYANAKSSAKDCREIVAKLTLTADAMLSQTASIGEVVRTIAKLKEDFRLMALNLEKRVGEEEVKRKTALIGAARVAYLDHVAALEKEIVPIKMVSPQPDFAGAIKSKRTTAALMSAVNTTLANGKIAADAEAKDLRAKLGWLYENASDYKFLFSDLNQLIRKPMDDFVLMAQSRITAHKAAEEAKIAAEREAAIAQERRRNEAEAAKIAAERVPPLREDKRLPLDVAPAPTATAKQQAAIEQAEPSDNAMIALKLMYWWFFAEGSIKKPEWVVNHPAWPGEQGKGKLINLVESVVLQRHEN